MENITEILFCSVIKMIPFLSFATVVIDGLSRSSTILF